MDLTEPQKDLLTRIGMTLIFVQMVEHILRLTMTFVFQKASPLTLEVLEVSRSRQFDGCEIEIIDGLPDWSSRTSVETAGTGTGNPRRSTIAVVTRRAPLPRLVVFRFDTASVPSCSRPARTSPSGGREKRGHP